MKKNIVCFIIFILSVSVFISVVSTKDKETPVGMFLKIKSNVGIKRANTDKWLIAEENMPIYKGDTIKTLAKSWTEVLFDNGVAIKIEEKTVFTVEKISPDKKSTENSIRLKSGFILSDIKKVSKVQIYTPTAVAAVRGTLFVVSVDTTGASEVCVFKGSVTVTSEGKEETEGMTVNENQVSKVSEDVSPSMSDVLDERLTVYRDTIAYKFEIAVERYREMIDELIKQRDTWIENLQKQRENKIENLKKRQEDLLKKLNK